MYVAPIRSTDHVSLARALELGQARFSEPQRSDRRCGSAAGRLGRVWADLLGQDRLHRRLTADERRRLLDTPLDELSESELNLLFERDHSHLEETERRRLLNTPLEEITRADRESLLGIGLFDKYLGELTDAERRELFGGQAARVAELAARRPKVRVRDMAALRYDPELLERTCGLLRTRPELSFDHIELDHLEAALKEPRARELLETRHDLAPADLSRMSGSFDKILGNPELGRRAYREALEVLRLRPDLRPEGMVDFLKATPGRGVQAEHLFTHAARATTRRAQAG